MKNPRLKVYYLSSCDTCARIMKEVDVAAYPFELQDIKSEKITAAQLDEMARLAALQNPKIPPYESLFSKIAMKYRSMGLNKMTLSESDYRNYILEEYTFLKRPVFIIDDTLYIGNAAKTTAAVAAALQNRK
ncbi:MAG TPA: arsenate reductase [Bacteroidetes bacterium]|jgi:arsenate reductase (glutaredoxin)|nr:MAG: hypothetical protein ABR94_13435 [Sphingobacteriales bacterium BACL12 MAG-120802-bin5]HCK21407.1 arsenate reductase [Bacteroidota bacterium]